VFMMQAGFAMLCAGCVRQKNVKNIMLKNLLDACFGALGFYSIGYGIAYGGDTTNTTFLGTSFFGLRNYPPESFASWFFQFAFAATAATIVAGTVAERCKMAAYVCYSFFLTAFVYPVIVHAAWSGNGWIGGYRSDDNPFLGIGVIDFAGSGVVHMTGGVTAFYAAIILGPRRGRFYDEDGNLLETPTTWPPHSVALQVLGTFLLWFGWYGFNPGSTLAIANPASGTSAAVAAVTTTLAPGAGAVAAMFFDSIIEAYKTGEVSYDITMVMNGALSGLVAITAGCSTVPPFAAVIIGAISGIIYRQASKLILYLRIDDAVDAIPVHFANGAWGLFAVGLFARQDLVATAGYHSEHFGAFFGGGGHLLACQIIFILFIIGWVGVTMIPFFYILNLAGMYRVDPLEEEVGLDISHHRGAAYDLKEANKEDVEELMEIRASKHGKVEVPQEVARAAKVSQTS